MTREEAKRLSNVLKAYSEGKIIQYQENGKHRYADLRFYDFPNQDNISLETQEYNYRIKPEPKYRPLKNQEECWLEMHKHPDFGWGLNNIGEYVNLSRISNDSIYTKGDAFDFNKALKGFRFTDGKPFGIMED